MLNSNCEVFDRARLEIRVTERTAQLAAAKEEAEQATRVRSAFIANISHEIRTPLNAIIGMAWLCRQTPLEPAQQAHLEKIGHAAQNLMRLVSQILDVSKIESGGLQLEHADFSIDEVLNNLDNTHGILARSRGLGFEIHKAPSVPSRVHGDALRLEQILTNLIGNAVKFTSKGSVIVEVAVAGFLGGHIELAFAVRDTGIGISADQIPRLFTPFTQADSSTTRRFGGSGLGLTISKRLVELMGGNIHIESTPGIGSTFHFTVIVARAAHQSVPMPELQPPAPTFEIQRQTAPLQNARILVAEDNEFNQDLMRELLERSGATVTIAENGQEAIDAIMASPDFDLVLMDLQMPGLDGLEATRRIRSNPVSAGLVILALTANADAEQRESCRRVGMDDFIAKPFTPEHLLETVQAWISSPGLAKESLGQQAVPEPPVEVDQEIPGATVDWNQLNHITQFNAARRERFVAKYLENCDSIQTELESARQLEDWKRVAQLAHRLKGSAATIGALRCAELCRRIEDACNATLPDAAFAYLSQLPECIRQTRHAFTLPGPVPVASVDQPLETFHA